MNNEKLVACPFNPVHRVGQKRLAIHITKCKKFYPDMRECVFNANHWVHKDEFSEHCMNCPNKNILDSFINSSNENSVRGDISVPTYNVHLNTQEDEEEEEEGEWDKEMNNPNAVAFQPKKAIFANTQGLEPAQRKEVYKELFREAGATSSTCYATTTDNQVANSARQSSLPSKPFVSAPQNTYRRTTYQNNIGVEPPAPIFEADDFPALGAAVKKETSRGNKRNDYVQEDDYPALPNGRDLSNEYPALGNERDVSSVTTSLANCWLTPQLRQPSNAPQYSNKVAGYGRGKQTAKKPKDDQQGGTRGPNWGRGAPQK